LKDKTRKSNVIKDGQYSVQVCLRAN